MQQKVFQPATRAPTRQRETAQQKMCGLFLKTTLIASLRLAINSILSLAINSEQKTMRCLMMVLLIGLTSVRLVVIHKI